MPRYIKETGFDWKKIRERLDKEEWQDEIDNPKQQIRTIYIGKSYNIVPSNKYYTPFACSNVEVCPYCHGERKQKQGTKSKRRQSKWETKQRRMQKKFSLLPLGIRLLSKTAKNMHRAYQNILKYGLQDCPHCEGVGSIEALKDQQWFECLEKETIENGIFNTSNDGDPTDFLLAEVREKLEEKE